MRYTLILLAAVLLGVAGGKFTGGQDNQGDGSATPSNETNTATDRSYSIEIIEFQIDASDGAELSADQLVESYAQMKSDGKLTRAEIIRLSAQEQKVSFVQFGKQVALTTGSQSVGPGRPAARQVRQFDIGTTAEVRLVSTGNGQVSMDFVYKSSRVEGEGTDHSPPDIVSISIETPLVLALGKTKLLGGTSADPNVYVMITISD